MRDRYRETPPECPMCGDWDCDGDCPEADERDRFESDNWRDEEASEEVEPCPRCRSTASAENYDGLWCIACDNPTCNVALEDDSFLTAEEAESAWNRYVAHLTPGPPEEVEP